MLQTQIFGSDGYPPTFVLGKNKKDPIQKGVLGLFIP